MECPVCKAKHDDVAFVGWKRKRAPAAGDISVCIMCGAILCFTGVDLSTRLLTQEELAGLSPIQRYQLGIVQQAIKDVQDAIKREKGL